MTSDEFTNEQLDENLHKWFKEKWVRFGPDGKIRGACARGDDSEGKPKCLPQKKAQNLGKKGRKYAASKKRREDPNPERTGKAKNVATKKKTNEEKCPECGGAMYPESMINEKQDACYRKVKSRYKVWPSAYASGALVQCRKKGASNWGTGGKKDESSIMKGIVDEAGSAAQQAAIAISKKERGEKPKNVGEAKAKPYVKPFIENGKQVGWKSSDGYHVKYWRLADSAKAKAYQHAKIGPDEVQEDYASQFSAEKTPTVNPHAGIKDNQFRGAIGEALLSEMPDTSGPVGVQPGGWRTYKPKPAGQIKEDEKLDTMFEPTIDKLHDLVNYEIKNAAITLTDDPYEDIAKILYNLGLSKIEIDHELIDQLIDKMEDSGLYDKLWEDTAYAGGMGQGGNAGQSYRKFKPKSAGTFKEAAGQKYEVRFANGKTQRFVAVSPEEAKKKAKGLGASSLIKINKDGMPKGKVEEEQLDEKCWDTHKQVGMKNKGGKQVPNCVPKESAILKGILGRD